MTAEAAPSAVARLTANDFFTGLFSALKLHGQTAFSLRGDRFDAVIKQLYDRLSESAAEQSLDLRFRVRPHPIYGDSKTVRKALSAAAQRRIVSFDNPEYLDIRIKLDDVEAARKLAQMPVPRDVFDGLADQFIQLYREQR